MVCSNLVMVADPVTCSYCLWLIAVPSSAPRMLRVTNVSSNFAVFTWEAPPPEDLNGFVIGYFINMTVLLTGERLEVFSNSTMPTVYNLKPYTVYTCVSAAVTNAGRGPFSDAIQIQTLEAGKCYVYILNFTVSYTIELDHSLDVKSGLKGFFHPSLTLDE